MVYTPTCVCTYYRQGFIVRTPCISWLPLIDILSLVALISHDLCAEIVAILLLLFVLQKYNYKV